MVSYNRTVREVSKSSGFMISSRSWTLDIEGMSFLWEMLDLLQPVPTGSRTFIFPDPVDLNFQRNAFPSRNAGLFMNYNVIHIRQSGIWDPQSDCEVKLRKLTRSVWHPTIVLYWEVSKCSWFILSSRPLKFEFLGGWFSDGKCWICYDVQGSSPCWDLEFEGKLKSWKLIIYEACSI